VKAFGRLDFAFNNAGIEGVNAVAHEYPEDEFDRVIAVNLKGVYLGMKCEIPAMLANGGLGFTTGSAIEVDGGMHLHAV